MINQLIKAKEYVEDTTFDSRDLDIFIETSNIDKEDDNYFIYFTYNYEQYVINLRENQLYNFYNEEETVELYSQTIEDILEYLEG